MKKKIILGLISLFVFPSIVAAAPSYSLTSSASKIEKGSRVTFTITLKNVASWNLKGTGIGATSNCKLSDDVRVGDTGTGQNTTKTFNVSCVATDIGIINFEISGSISQADGTNINKVNVSANKSVTVIAVQPKSTNNYLQSIGVEGYEITPEFNKETAEYSTSVPSTIEKVTLTATKEDSKATIKGTGEKEVQEGNNTFDIVVVAQNGSERTYKINVIVEDQNPIPIDIDGTKYTIIKNVKNIEVPELFIESTFHIEDTEVPAYFNETTRIKLIAVKDEAGKVFFAKCHEDGTFSLYQPLKSYGLQLILLEPTTLLNGFEKQTVQVNGQDVVAMVHGNIKIVYAKNLETNEDDFYLYDEKNMTYAKYSNDMVEELLERNQLMTYILIGLSAGMGFIFLIMLIILLCKKKPKQKVMPKEEIKEEKVSKKKKIEEVVEETPKKNEKKKGKKQKKEVVEEKKEEVSTEVVEEIKTEEVKTEETPKIIETVEEMEEEFYSILEDKPMKRPKK